MDYGLSLSQLHLQRQGVSRSIEETLLYNSPIRRNFPSSLRKKIWVNKLRRFQTFQVELSAQVEMSGRNCPLSGIVLVELSAQVELSAPGGIVRVELSDFRWNCPDRSGPNPNPSAYMK
jgi:hypothetical protein